MRLLSEKGWRVGNVDCTIALEKPKVNPHISEMKKVMAPLMNITEDDISIKATTTETMGYVGREEGVNAYAVALILKRLVMIEIITTGDGSHSLQNHQLNETYHSIHGALQESIHVFIKSGLDYIIERDPVSEIRILEIGFGTGLNALLTWKRSNEIKNKISYTTLEAFPVSDEIWPLLNYTNSETDREGFSMLHQAKWNEPVVISSHFELLKLHTTLEQVDLRSDSFDVIYYDAFAPNKQPELWTLSVLEKVAKTLKPSGILVTYCAKGQLKRDLRSLSLEVDTLSGPPGKKRDGSR